MNRILSITVPIFLLLSILGITLSYEGKPTGQSYKSNAYSYSLVGFRGLVEFLKRRGFEVHVNNHIPVPPSYSSGDAGVLVLSPDSRNISPYWSRMKDQFDQKLIVLPRWKAVPHKKNSRWISEKKQKPVKSVERILGKGAPRKITRPDWRSNNPELRLSGTLGGEGYSLNICDVSPQVFPRNIKAPVLARIGSYPFAVQDRHDQNMIWISDPDVFTNQHLGKCENSVFVDHLLSRVFGSKKMVIDEVHHGFQKRGDLLGILFTFPGLFFTITGVLFILCFYWWYLNRWKPKLAEKEEHQPSENNRIRSRKAQANALGQITYLHGDHERALEQYIDHVLDKVHKEIGILPPKPKNVRNALNRIDPSIEKTYEWLYKAKHRLRDEQFDTARSKPVTRQQITKNVQQIFDALKHGEN